MIDGVTLAVEGSTYAGSVALLSGNDVIGEASLPDSEKPGRGGREEHFMPMVAACMRAASIVPSDLARVVCGAGPGSFTSLRVAGSIAKGIAVGAGVPLYAVSSLLLMVAAADVGTGRWLAVLPAMRGEVFASLFEVTADGILDLEPPCIVRESDFEREAEHRAAKAIGPFGKNPVAPLARGAVRVMERIVADGKCDIAAWEPVYGRLAEAQVRWEAAHGRPLGTAE